MLATVSLFWNTNMAAVTSCENALWAISELPQASVSKPKQCEAVQKCEAIDMKMVFYSLESEIHFHKKGFALDSFRK